MSRRVNKEREVIDELPEELTTIENMVVCTDNETYSEKQASRGQDMIKTDTFRRRVIIENVTPQIDGGVFPAKRVVGEKVVVCADIFTEGHFDVGARLYYRKEYEKDWHIATMHFSENDRFCGEFIIEEETPYCYTLEGWTDTFKTWRNDLQKRFEASQDIRVDLLVGIELLGKIIDNNKNDKDVGKVRQFLKKIKDARDKTQAAKWALKEDLLNLIDNFPDKESLVAYDKILKVEVERKKALFSSWYEFFPRSFGSKQASGTFNDAERLLPEIARMGFDVVYLPPIHPIGRTNRKGRNNILSSDKKDPGCPWAIGSKKGGHKSIDPKLGSMEDFLRFVDKAKALGLEVAMDLAYQCSPDHPYVKKHPEWFTLRPDGTIQFSENPPKKYEDIYPINFDTDQWQELWLELKSIVEFWVKQGINIFRVDNPHTKPFGFWKWLISEIKKDNPQVLFLSEAFTKPKAMKQLAKLGFSQSYTYFTWRTTKWDFTQYLTELTQSDMREYFRPNFWPNTPDILPYHLQHGGRPAFISRLILAATLSSNYGIYGPAFELCVSDALSEREEYLNSEKYEIKHWDCDRRGNLKDLIARINKIRKENPALQSTRNIQFCEIQNDNILCYLKTTEDLSNVLLVVVNLDPLNTQSGWVKVPLYESGIDSGKKYKISDLISEDEYVWQDEWNFVQLNPFVMPAHISKITKI